MQVSGALLDIEHKFGAFDGDDGKKVSYDFVVLHVLDGREVVKVRLPNEVNIVDLQVGKGELVHLDISVPPATKVRFVCMTADAPSAV